MSEYADITLLECNRKQSIQKETKSNNSLWTNRMGEVVELGIGDEISIEAGFINQRGCANPSSIEFKGKSLGVNGLFTYSQDYDNTKPELSSHDTPTSENNEVQLSSTLFRWKTNQQTEIELKDNEVNIEVSYYKNMNGEQHIYLPRTFIPENRGGANYPAIQNEKDIFINSDYSLDSLVAGETRSFDLGVNSGQVNYFPITFGQAGEEFYPNQGINMRYFNPNDYGLFSKNTSPAGQTWEGTDLPNDANPNVGDRVVLEVRPFIDNSRYTLFTLDFYFQQYNEEVNVPFTYTDSSGDKQTYNLNGKNFWDLSYPAELKPLIFKYNIMSQGDQSDPNIKVNSPALSHYSKNIDLITLKLKKGFNSPQSIAEQLTQQLQEEREDSPEIFNKLGQHGGTNQLSYIVKSKTFKTYDAANYGDLTHDKSNQFLTYYHNKDSFEYYRSYQNIFVKRPDLFEAGRKCNSPNGNVGFYSNQENRYISHTEYTEDTTATTHFGKPNFIRNYLILNKLEDGTTPFGNYTTGIITSWEWNSENLKNLQNLFKVQGRYPELFKNLKTTADSENLIWRNETFTGNIAGTTTPIPAPTHPTINNSRFLHMNRFAYEETDYTYLGSDGYQTPEYQQSVIIDNPNANFKLDHRSLPIFFLYQPENEDKYYEEPNISNLCYGFADRFTDPTTKISYIELHTEAPYSQGVHLDFFKYRGGNPSGSAVFQAADIEGYTNIIGWDYSFNSWGNVVSLGFTGMPLASFNSEYELGLGTDFNDTETAASVQNEKYTKNIKSAVIGANNPAVVYDSVSGKFGFSDLHIPEKIGQEYNAGQTATIVGTSPIVSRNVPIIDDAKNVCYKINKRTRAGSYCPDLNGTTFTEQGNTQAINALKNNIMTFAFFNSRISPYTIFDSHMGVNLDLGNTFKITDSNKQPEIWDNGLMGLLGFTYEQFNPKKITTENTGLARIDFRNIESVFNPTTNSEVLNTDIQDFTMNPYGGVEYNPVITTPIKISTFYGAQGTPPPTFTNKTYFPPIVQDTSSIKIEGLNLPKLVQRPYLTIRSDILSNSKYIGGKSSGLSLPVISVINKINADKDFIQVSDTQFNYTITRPTKFSEITTAITNPDGTLADTEDGNAIIYKIRKRGDLTNFDIIAQILQEQSKKGKKK